MAYELKQAAELSQRIDLNVPYATYDFVAANVLRKYGADGMMHSAGLAHRRLRAWGLNTIANWSSPLVWKLRRTPYTVTLNTHGAPRRAGSKGWWGPLAEIEVVGQLLVYDPRDGGEVGLCESLKLFML